MIHVTVKNRKEYYRFSDGRTCWICREDRILYVPLFCPGDQHNVNAIEEFTEDEFDFGR